ncbi:MAG: N-6 DNA methylase [Desulfuromonadales bacterium]|nr:N-6 DNA methylase [Desulfuromonadales bacterium]
MSGLSDNKFKDELNCLEMLPADGEPTSLFFVANKEDAEAHIRIALEQAESYEANAVFFRMFPEGDKRSPIPQIYIYHDNDLFLNEARYARIHLRLWNAGVVPLVFILTAGQVKIINCRQEPAIDKTTNGPVYTPFHILEKIVAANRAFVAREVAAGTLWENPKFKNDFSLENTAYYKLLSHLNTFRQKLLKLDILSEPTVNRILVMAILVKYLNDRKDSAENRVFEHGFLRRFSHANNDDLEALFREKGSCIRLFYHLSGQFNGGIFELNDNEKIELGQADLSPIADFLKGDLDPNNGQMLFWPLYSFQDLPVELISNIYEEFLAKKDAKTKKKGLETKDTNKEGHSSDKGVVYTPPMLVDFLLDQCLPLKAETLSWKILDPACGSGIFLVGAFKRLIQCWRIANDWRQPTHLDLKEILKNSIFGFDEKPEAVLITAFSLCVALCDELEPLVIWKELKFDNLQNRNLLAKDFFEIIESGKFDNHFDLIVGNPPFESKLTTPAAKRVEAANATNRPKLPDTQLALLFLEQSFRLARKDAAVCLIQPAGPLLYNGNALPFRGYLFEQFAINQVFDFTPLEGSLFSKAQVAAAAIVGRNAPVTEDKILHVTFRRTRAIKEKLLFELDPYDFHWIARSSIAKRQYVWKANLLGGGRLHRMLDRLFTDTLKLGEYLEQKRVSNGWQFGEGYSVGCGSYLNDQPNIQELVKLSPVERMKLFKLKIPPITADWITGKKQVPPKALTVHGIDWKDVKTCEDVFFQRTCSNSRAIFSAPHVLISEKVDGLAIPAAFIDKYLVFTNRFVGVYAPEDDKAKLQKLASNLNDSGLFGILAAIISNQMLVGRATALLKSDIMELPYPDDEQDIDLNFWEQALVEDIGNYLIDFRRNGEASSVLTKADDSDLRSFGEMYCNILNPVYKQFRPLSPIPMGSFICFPFCFGDTPQLKLPQEDTVVPYLEELLHHQPGSRLFINRILRLYEQNVIFMIKPNQKRYWLRSIALRDADETLIDLLGQGY